MTYRSIIVVLAALMFAAACSTPETRPAQSTPPSANGPAGPSAQQSDPASNSQGNGSSRAPATGITAADIAKIKWLEGAWRGSGAVKPFFNTYHFTATTLDMASYEDEAMTKKADSAHYEIKDGMFQTLEGKSRFAASEIADDHIQFISLTGGPQAFGMKKADDGNVKATLEGIGNDGKPFRMTYTLEPLKK